MKGVDMLKKKSHVYALPLFSGMAVLMSEPTRPQHEKKKKPIGEVTPLSPEDLADIKKANYRDKRKRQNMQKEAEKMRFETNQPDMYYYSVRNNSALKHLAYFTNIAEYATRNNLPLAMGEHSMSLKADLLPQRWSCLRAWVTKNLSPCCLVSIGRKPKGWWTIRWMIVGDNQAADLFSLISPFGAYLAKTGWRTKAVVMDADSSRLRDHYLSRLDDDEETINLYVPEMFEIFRAGLTLPRCSRTIRNNSAKGILETLKVPVNNTAAYTVNGHFGSGGTSYSGVALCTITKTKGRITDAEWIGAKGSHDTEDDDFDIYSKYPQNETRGDF